jgi:4-carboxymuconolactone decarboxylase
MGAREIDQTYREVMALEPLPPTSLFDRASREFVFGIWGRPGLSRRDRRWVTLSCVASAGAPVPMEAHAYAALRTGDISLDEALEFVLQFAVYAGWPKASNVEGQIRRQWARIEKERGDEPRPWPPLPLETLGENDWKRRIEQGERKFAEVNLGPGPNPDSPFMQAGILAFVFGHVWQRPGLSRRDRRLITLPLAAISDAPIPIQAHVTSALHSGDITKSEMDEIALHLSVYHGFLKGEALSAAAEAAWATRPNQ